MSFPLLSRYNHYISRMRHNIKEREEEEAKVIEANKSAGGVGGMLGNVGKLGLGTLKGAGAGATKALSFLGDKLGVKKKEEEEEEQDILVTLRQNMEKEKRMNQDRKKDS